MKKMLKLVAPLVILTFSSFIFMACHQKTPNLIKTGEISMERNLDEKFKGYFENDSMNSLVIFNTEEKKLYFKSIYDFQEEMTIALYQVLTNVDSRGLFTLNVFTHTPDSVFLSYNEIVLLVNRHGDLLRSWNLNEHQCFKQNNLSISFVTPLTFLKDKVIFALVANLIANSPEASKQYFSEINPVGVLDITKDTFYMLPIHFPKMYRTENNFMDFVPQFISFHDKLLISFAVCDTLRLFNIETNKLESSVVLRSKHFKKPEPYPFDSIHNYAFARRYRFSEMRYKDVHYDEKSDLLLRMVNLPTELFVSGVPTVKKTNDWSLILFDLKKNHIVDEIFFNSENYQPYFLITKRGVMIWRMLSQESDSLKVDIFRLQEKQ